MRPDPRRALRISRLLSLALRHQPSALALTLDPHGWASVDATLAGLAAAGLPTTADELEDLVRSSDKQRFALSPDGERIRANQGHSVDIDLALPAREPPERLYHGTVVRFLASILADGLVRGARTHVHLSPDVRTAEIVASRRSGPQVILEVRAAELHRAGHVFVRSENGVWLTHAVPPAYLARR